jgi:hypothetical protein
MSLWCSTWLKSSDRQSWTIWAIICPSSSMIVYSRGYLCAFVFLRVPSICVVGLLFPPGSCELGLGVVSCLALACFCCYLADFIFSFFPFWVPIFVSPSFVFVVFVWPVLHFLGTWTSFGCVSPCPASSSIVFSVKSWVRDGILHSSSQSLITRSMSPSVIQ